MSVMRRDELNISVLEKRLPIIAWVRNYKKADLRGDLSAGITTAVMIVPQGMAYAMLAGLPPIMGLYAAIVPLIVYAIFGTSRQLAVGPVAMDSLLVFSSVSVLAKVGTDQYITLTIVLAFVAGAIQVIMGIFRLGFLVNFLSKPVISGFTAAAALVIAFSQLKDILGIQIQRTHLIHTILLQAIGELGSTSIITLCIGLLSIVTMVMLKKKSPMFPRALSVVAVGTLATYFFELTRLGVAVVGDVPAGFPIPQLPVIDKEILLTILPTAAIVALIGFMEAISISKGLATKHGYDLDPNQELIGIGLANIAAGIFRGYTVTGGFSRTAVNESAGANTPLAALITAALVTVTLLYLTPLFYFLPRSVLAAIIITSVFGLIDIGVAKHLWKIKRRDFGLYLLTFFATLAFGIVVGLGVGVAASLIVFIERSTKPHFAVLGRIENTTSYRNIKNYENLERYENLLLLRIDSQFYFGNVNFLKSTIDEQGKLHGPLKAVILDMSGVNQIDATGEGALCEIQTRLEGEGITLFFANMKKPVSRVLVAGEVCDDKETEKVFLTVHDAVMHFLHTKQKSTI